MQGQRIHTEESMLVDGIDVLVSGHTHNRMYQPVVENGAMALRHGRHAARSDCRGGGHRSRLLEWLALRRAASGNIVSRTSSAAVGQRRMKVTRPSASWPERHLTSTLSGALAVARSVYDQSYNLIPHPIGFGA
jgi:hypothetical protein